MHVPSRPAPKTILDADAVARTLARVAHELIERNEVLDDLVLVGIHRRGLPLAQRLRRLVEERSGVSLELGAVDITFHRDDVLVRAGARPAPPSRSCTRRSSTWRSRAARSSSSTTSSTRAARSAPRSRR